MKSLTNLVNSTADNLDETVRWHSHWAENKRKNPLNHIVATVVLGSGLNGFAEERKQDKNSTVIPYSHIDGFPEPSIAGHSGELILTPINYLDDEAGWVAILSGRGHGYEFAHPLARRQIVVPVLALAACGCKTFILTNAVGGVNKSAAFAPGNIVLLKDHINLSGWNPLLGNVGAKFQRFPSMTRCYNYDRRVQVLSVARNVLKKSPSQGTLATLLGPNFETAAEVRSLATLGADVVGMSVAYETIALRGLVDPPEIIGLSCVVNWAEGVTAEPIAHDKVLEVAGSINPELSKLIHGVITDMVEKNIVKT